MSKFTPGKWVARISEEYNRTGHEAIIHAGKFVNTHCYTGDYIALVHTAADARLMAAAPDMYRFVKNVEILAHYYLDSRFIGLLRDARELLARINGEQEAQS